MNFIRLSVILALVTTCFAVPAYAFKEDSTHRQLTAAAIQPSASNIKNYLINNLGLSEGYDTTLNGVDRKGNSNNYSIATWLQEGSEDEDALSFCRASNHFHNPIHSGDWLSSQMSDSGWVDAVCGSTRFSNVTWATGYAAPITSFIASRAGQDMGWDNARTYFYQSLTSQDSATREERLVKTFKSVGMVMHLLQDMAVPAHTRNDMSSHLFNSYNPFKWFSNPFEKYVINHYSAISNTPIKPTFTAPIRHTDFWDKDIYSGANPSNSTDQGLAEYSNANFFSDSTIPTNGPSLEHQFPNPQITSASYICTDTLPGSKKPTKYISRTPCPTSGGTVDHFAAVSLVNSESDSASASTVKKAWLDNNVHDTYANDLLPRTVGYSAALLDHFFRGSIVLTLPAKGIYSIAAPNSTGYTEIRVKARNSTTTNEEMSDGTLQLVVKYKMALSDPFQSTPVDAGPEQYIVVTEKNNIRTLSRTATTELVFDLSSSPLPFWAVDVYLQVVYKGQLGNESGAVALGLRDISEPTPIDIVNHMDLVCVNNTLMTAGSAAAISAVDTDHNGTANWDVFPHGLTNVYVAFNGALASSSNRSAIFANIPPGNYGRVFVLGDYSVSSSALLVSTAATVQKISPLDVWSFYFGTEVDAIDALDNQNFYPLMYVVRGLNSWWYTYYDNPVYPANSTCDFSTASPNITGPVTVTIP
jgi:hypothetical protein